MESDSNWQNWMKCGNTYAYITRKAMTQNERKTGEKTKVTTGLKQVSKSWRWTVKRLI